MDLKEIQNLIKFVSNSGVAEVKLEMDDVKITIRTTLEGNVTETTYVQQLPAQATLPQAVVPQQAAPRQRKPATRASAACPAPGPACSIRPSPSATPVPRQHPPTK